MTTPVSDWIPFWNRRHSTSSPIITPFQTLPFIYKVNGQTHIRFRAYMDFCQHAGPVHAARRASCPCVPLAPYDGGRVTMGFRAFVRGWEHLHEHGKPLVKRTPDTDGTEGADGTEGTEGTKGTDGNAKRSRWSGVSLASRGSLGSRMSRLSWSSGSATKTEHTTRESGCTTEDTPVETKGDTVWKQVVSREGQTYYWNTDTDETQYEVPGEGFGVYGGDDGI